MIGGTHYDEHYYDTTKHEESIPTRFMATALTRLTVSIGAIVRNDEQWTTAESPSSAPYNILISQCEHVELLRPSNVSASANLVSESTLGPYPFLLTCAARKT
jgi:hypothetical protein